MQTISPKLMETKFNRQDFMEMSYPELSKATDITIATWSNWMNDRMSPNLRKLREIAPLFGMTLLEFVAAFEERKERTIHRRKERTGVDN